MEIFRSHAVQEHAGRPMRAAGVTPIRIAPAGSGAPDAWDAMELAAAEAINGGMDYETALAAFKRTFVAFVLRDQRGNQCGAAAILNIHRNTLNKACRDLMIEPKIFRRPARGLRH